MFHQYLNYVQGMVDARRAAMLQWAEKRRLLQQREEDRQKPRSQLAGMVASQLGRFLITVGERLAQRGQPQNTLAQRSTSDLAR
jgi:hypothetical protein